MVSISIESPWKVILFFLLMFFYWCCHCSKYSSTNFFRVSFSLGTHLKNTINFEITKLSQLTSWYLSIMHTYIPFVKKNGTFWDVLIRKLPLCDNTLWSFTYQLVFLNGWILFHSISYLTSSLMLDINLFLIFHNYKTILQ